MNIYGVFRDLDTFHKRISICNNTDTLEIDLDDSSQYEKFRKLTSADIEKYEVKSDILVIYVSDTVYYEISRVMNEELKDDPLKLLESDGKFIHKIKPANDTPKNKPLIVNLFGGPGVGKSTLAMKLAADLKMKMVETEYVSEYAKDLVYEHRSLTDQIMIFAEQNRRIKRLINPNNHVDIVICDAPIILSAVYEEFRRSQGYHVKSEHFTPFMIDIFKGYNNLNFFLKRVGKYSTVGRVETQEESEKIDGMILNVLRKNCIPFQIKTREDGDNILKEILKYR